MEAERITKLVAGEAIFHSTGTSYVKVTIAGVEKPLALPIKSAGLAEFMSELSQSTPKPPVKREFIRKKSDEGKAAGLKRDQWVEILDIADDAYQEALEQYQDDFTWRVVCYALDIEFRRQDGSVLTDFQEKKQVLKGSGISGHQLDQIFKDVRALTKRSEGDADFLSGNDSE